MHLVKGRKVSVKNVLVNYFGLDKTKNFLDIGCAATNGEITNYISSFAKKTTGIDIDGEGIKKAITHQKKNATFVIANIEKLPFKDNSFDIISCTEVIEHVQNPGVAASEMNRVVAKNGAIYLTTPNYFWFIEPHYMLPFYHFLPNYFRSSYAKLTGRDMETFSEVRLFTYGKLKKLLEKNNFKVENITFEVLSNMSDLGFNPYKITPIVEILASIINRSPSFVKEVSYLLFPTMLLRLTKK
ncbi:class I SAM-dependent methyltransferase [Candidatus Undinarchaeota archaeon]